MTYWVLLLLSLVCCSVGFYMYIWFFSVGYGLAIAGLGAAFLCGFHKQIGFAEVLACVLLIMYGLRLSGYLLLREKKSAAYRKVLSPEAERSKRMPIGAKLGLWAACGVLYTLMTSPLYFRLRNGAAADPMMWIGLIVMICGVVLELAADHQKSAAKKKNSHRFVDTGLYRFVRCPNYFGEILLWTGMLLTGVTALHGALQWILSILGYILILWVMFSGARRLELRQDRNYGNDEEYLKYVRSVPIIIPFIPLYSVKDCKILVA